MRFALLAAALALPGVAAAADAPRPSLSACDTAKLGARDLADCLRTASDKSDKELAATLEAAIKSVETRPKLLSSQKTRWKRSLNDAQSQWIGWCDSECQDVAPFEAGMNAKGGDPRLSCIIDQNSRRIADIKARYQ